MGKKLVLAIALLMASFQINAQLDDCRYACSGYPMLSLTSTINYPNFGVVPFDHITYTFYYKICDGVLYMHNMTWKAKFNGADNAYTVKGYDRVNDILNIIWANISGVGTVAFPASCFKMELRREAKILAEGLISGQDFSTAVYCDRGCCVFKKGEFAGDALEMYDISSGESCEPGCWPLCRGNGSKVP